MTVFSSEMHAVRAVIERKIARADDCTKTQLLAHCKSFGISKSQMDRVLLSLQRSKLLTYKATDTGLVICMEANQ